MPLNYVSRAHCLQLSVFSHNAPKSLKCSSSNLNVTLIVIKQLITTFVVPNSLLTNNQIEVGGECYSYATNWHNVSNLTSAAPLPPWIHQDFVVTLSVKADSHIACRAVPLIHTCHDASLPCSDSAVSFVKARVIAGNIRTASPTVQQIVFFVMCCYHSFFSSMTNVDWFHTGHLRLRLVCFW